MTRKTEESEQAGKIVTQVENQEKPKALDPRLRGDDSKENGGDVAVSSAIPASPPAIPASPPAIPASPPAIPASPSAIPASPPAIPASPSAIPASPPVIPASPSAIPASPPVIPAQAGTQTLESIDALSARYRLPTWQQAALTRMTAWVPGKTVTEEAFLAALATLSGRKLGGGRV